MCDSVHRGGLQSGRTPPGPGRENPTPPRTWQGEPPRDLAGRNPPGPGRPPRTWQGEPPLLPDQAGRNPPPGTWQGEPPLGPGRENPPGTWQGEPPPGTWQGETPPPREEDCSIRSMSGRYASYWNAFLLQIKIDIFPKF